MDKIKDSTPGYWVVKGRPDRNDFEVWLEPGRDDTWRTKRPPLSWAKDDQLFFWKAAPDLCVVGLGFLRSAPIRSQARGRRVRFGVQYLTGYLEHPVGINEARQDKEMREASFLKSGPSATLYPLSPSEAKALYRLVVQRNPALSGLWPEFANRAKPELITDIDDTLPGGTEGRRRLVSHFNRERDRGLVQAKKAAVLAKQGNLACEVCGFDFAACYGELGQDFCEVHHLLPLSALNRERHTKLSDLAVVCSNCHRMIHSNGATRSIRQLRTNMKSP